jgi:hypothetical protein
MIEDRDRLPRWLYERYGQARGVYVPWDDLNEGARIFWQEEADTVIRAVLKLALYKIVKAD